MVGFFVDWFVKFGVEDEFFKVGVVFGLIVMIGCGVGVVFDWEFMLILVVELIISLCGIDLCFDDNWCVICS